MFSPRPTDRTPRALDQPTWFLAKEPSYHDTEPSIGWLLSFQTRALLPVTMSGSSGKVIYGTKVPHRFALGISFENLGFEALSLVFHHFASDFMLQNPFCLILMARVFLNPAGNRGRAGRPSRRWANRLWMRSMPHLRPHLVKIRSSLRVFSGLKSIPSRTRVLRFSSLSVFLLQAPSFSPGPRMLLLSL